jgi:hypothetical protein
VPGEAVDKVVALIAAVPAETAERYADALSSVGKVR